MSANLKALQEMGAISRETIMEKSEIITDVDVEKKRLEGDILCLLSLICTIYCICLL